LIDQNVKLAKSLIFMLERLSVDSYWAHQASGLRGALLRCLEDIESGTDEDINNRLEELLRKGFDILERAAKEIPDNDQRVR
jgi:hypothetical protein